MPQQRNGFRTNELIVYPTHGVGQIVSIEENEVAETKLELFVINFEKERMTLRVPTGKSGCVGMRKLSEVSVVKKAFAILKGNAQVEHRVVWNRRILEYEDKIKSGNLIAIAEVVRDLFQPKTRANNQSYMEREIYESALDRMTGEIAAIQKVDRVSAISEIEEILLSRYPQPAAP